MKIKFSTLDMSSLKIMKLYLYNSIKSLNYIFKEFVEDKVLYLI